MQGQSVWAVRLWGGAESLRKWIRAKLPPVIQKLYEPFLALAHTQLHKHEFAAAWAKGCSFVVEGALDKALFQAPEEPVVRSEPAVPTTAIEMTEPPIRLTAREIEVLRWVTLGLTDIQVAEKLVISPRTVSTHLTSIYNKLGTSSRSAATRFAMEHHLI